MAENFKFITGEVVNIDDPTFAGRCKVRIKGYNDNVEPENLPWVTYGGSNVFSGNGSGGQISIPKVGSKVRVQQKKDDPNSFEWYALNRIDKTLSEELADDYSGSHVVLYDSEAELAIMYKPLTGLRIFFQDNYIQISPDDMITIHRGGSGSPDTIQMSDGRIDIQAQNDINLTSGGTIKLNSDTIVLNAASAVQIKGDSPGSMATNADELYKVLINLARMIDMKIPASGGVAANVVTGGKSAFMNEKIQFI